MDWEEDKEGEADEGGDNGADDALILKMEKGNSNTNTNTNNSSGSNDDQPEMCETSNSSSLFPFLSLTIPHHDTTVETHTALVG